MPSVSTAEKPHFGKRVHTAASTVTRTRSPTAARKHIHARADGMWTAGAMVRHTLLHAGARVLSSGLPSSSIWYPCLWAYSTPLRADTAVMGVTKGSYAHRRTIDSTTGLAGLEGLGSPETGSPIDA